MNDDQVSDQVNYETFVGKLNFIYKFLILMKES